MAECLSGRTSALCLPCIVRPDPLRKNCSVFSALISQIVAATAGRQQLCAMNTRKRRQKRRLLLAPSEEQDIMPSHIPVICTSKTDLGTQVCLLKHRISSNYSQLNDYFLRCFLEVKLLSIHQAVSKHISLTYNMFEFCSGYITHPQALWQLMASLSVLTFQNPCKQTRRLIILVFIL